MMRDVSTAPEVFPSAILDVDENGNIVSAWGRFELTTQRVGDGFYIVGYGEMLDTEQSFIIVETKAGQRRPMKLNHLPTGAHVRLYQALTPAQYQASHDGEPFTMPLADAAFRFNLYERPLG